MKNWGAAFFEDPKHVKRLLSKVPTMPLDDSEKPKRGLESKNPSKVIAKDAGVAADVSTPTFGGTSNSKKAKKLLGSIDYFLEKNEDA